MSLTHCLNVAKAGAANKGIGTAVSTAIQRPCQVISMYVGLVFDSDITDIMPVHEWDMRKP